jgi:hypothetical protein
LFAGHFYYIKSDQFTKTRSGQTFKNRKPQKRAARVSQLSDDCIGAVVVHLSDITSSRHWRKPCWVHLYGAPPEHDNAGQTGAAISGVFGSLTGGAIGGSGGPPKEEGSTPAERMNLGYEAGSAYRGRVLISLAMNTDVEKPTPSFPGAERKEKTHTHTHTHATTLRKFFA